MNAPLSTLLISGQSPPDARAGLVVAAAAVSDGVPEEAAGGDRAAGAAASARLRARRAARHALARGAVQAQERGPRRHQG